MLNLAESSDIFNHVKPPLPKINTAAGAEEWLADRVRRARKGVFAEKVVLTPELAAALLRRNDGNRGFRRTTLIEIIEDIRRGDWKLNGETLVVSEDGFLNDGQHRCRAVIETATAIETMITFGVARDSRQTVDIGAKRSPGDFLAMEGVQNAHLTAAVAKMLYQYGSLGRISSSFEDRPTAAMCQRFAHTYGEEIEAAIHSAPSAGSAKIGNKSIVVFALLLLRQRDPKAADHFVHRLCDGKELSGSDPIYVARERLSDPAARRLRANERLEIIFRHWNAWRKGRRMSKASPLTGKLPSLEA